MTVRDASPRTVLGEPHGRECRWAFAIAFIHSHYPKMRQRSKMIMTSIPSDLSDIRSGAFITLRRRGPKQGGSREREALLVILKKLTGTLAQRQT